MLSENESTGFISLVELTQRIFLFLTSGKSFTVTPPGKPSRLK